MKHASIIPLIGGESIGVEQATGTPPEFLLSYDAFVNHDSHLVNYYTQRGLDIPYHSLDNGAPSFNTKVDSVSSVCPCAGLSALSSSSHADSPVNDWMYTAAEYVLSEMKPQCYWGENAPALYTTKGKKVRDTLTAIGAKHGYTMSLYKTRSLLHGLPQVRNRSFFFFWKGESTPVFNYFDRPHGTIENVILESRGNSQTEPINHRIPSEDPFYAYILRKMYGGITHTEFVKLFQANEKPSMSVRSNDVFCMIEKSGEDLNTVKDWLRANNFEKGAKNIEHLFYKKSLGKGVMHRNTIVPHGHIGAFVGHYPYQLTHPVEDRYISYREAMTIMGLPSNFELLNPKKSINHICQNVPVQTAADMAAEVAAVLDNPNSREWRLGRVMQDNTAKRIDESGTATTLTNFF